MICVNKNGAFSKTINFISLTSIIYHLQCLLDQLFHYYDWQLVTKVINGPIDDGNVS